MKQGIKHGFAVIISALWLLNATAQKKDLPAPLPMPKAPAGVTIDGQLSEWDASSFIYNDDSKLKYMITSDDSYLYLVADLDQKAIKQKVLGAGITISINTEGKKKKSYSFSYPLPVTDETLSYVAKQHTRQANAKTDGFKGVDDNITLPDSHGFSAAFAFRDDGGMGYEVAIPLKALNFKPGANSLNINITVNALDKPMSGSSDASAATSSGGGGSRGGGSRGGGSRGGSKASSDASTATTTQKDDTPADLYNATDFWLSYTLPGK
jgi:hypothetical protein